MTVTEKRPTMPPSARVLTVVGLILVLTFFLDFLVRLMSPQLSKVEGQLTLLNELFDRGVIPLIGLALIYTGFWIYRSTHTTLDSEPTESLAAWQDPKFWSFVLASLLGVMFLVLIPLHFAKTGEVIQKALNQVDQEYTQNKTIVEQQLNQLKLEEQQWQAIIKDPTQLDQVLKNPELPPQQKAVLEQLKKDPPALQKALQDQVGQLQQQLTRVNTQVADFDKKKKEVTQQAEGERLVTRLRTAIRGLLLAIGFAAIGWTGIRDSSR